MGAARAVLAPAVAAIVLGILGMHAFAPHEGMAMSGHGPAGEPVMSMGGPLPMAGSTPVPVASPGTPGTAHASTLSLDGAGCAGMAMVCAFMVLGAAFVLLLSRSPSRWSVPRRRPPPWSRVVGALRRTTGPPAVWEYSVIRC